MKCQIKNLLKVIIADLFRFSSIKSCLLTFQPYFKDKTSHILLLRLRKTRSLCQEDKNPAGVLFARNDLVFLCVARWSPASCLAWSWNGPLVKVSCHYCDWSDASNEVLLSSHMIFRDSFKWLVYVLWNIFVLCIWM